LFVGTYSSSPAQPRPDPWAVAADIFDPPEHPYSTDPVAFASDELGFQAWSKQRDIIQAVRDHPRVAVRSSHGPGKTATAAQVALWFLAVHRNSRVITTAPTWAQVEQLLWREIRASVARAHAAGRGAEFPKPFATKLELGVEWFAIGLSTNEPERFQGHHADHLLLIVDEASGVDEKIFEAAEGFLTAEGAHMLLLGNPTRPGGQFHRAFTTERADWHTIHISTFDTPNYTGEPVPPEVARSLPRADWADEKKRAWGEGSPMYQVRVLGNFPSKAANGVCALHDVEQAQQRELTGREHGKPATIGVDVARFGDDDTVISVRANQRIRIRKVVHGKATTEVAGTVIRYAAIVQEETGALPIIVVDDVGVGGGVTDLLRERLPDHQVIGFNGGETAYDPDEYPNRRSELWFAMADALPELDLDQDEQLAADLTAPTYKIDSRGRRVVEPKKDTKKRLGRSPDRADSVMLTLVKPVTVTLPAADERGGVLRGDGSGYGRHELLEGSAPAGGSLTADLMDDLT
jgi:phage terminase large subunit